MIKKIILAVALALPMLSASAQNDLKIGLVDVNTIMQTLPEYSAANTELQSASKQYQDQRDKLMEEGQRMVDEFGKLPDNTLPAIRERKARDIQEHENKIQQFLQSAEQDLNRRQQELMQPILTKVRDAVEAVGREGNYSMIQMYEPSLTLYYAAPVEDISAKVKTKLGIQ